MKQKFLMILLWLSLVLTLFACGTETSSVDESESMSESEKTINSDTTKEDGRVTIKTKHFSIKIPKEWESLCSYQADDYSVSFTHKRSKEQGCGGFLFSIRIEDLSYYCDVEAKILGGLSIPNVGEFNVWEMRPSDVQSEGETHSEYLKCVEEIENIVSTLSFNDGYHFSKTPYEIKNNEYYAHNYEQNETQTSQQKYWPASANSSWNNLLNIGARFNCDPNTDTWYAMVGDRVCYWIPIEKTWMTEYDIK